MRELHNQTYTTSFMSMTDAVTATPTKDGKIYEKACPELLDFSSYSLTTIGIARVKDDCFLFLSDTVMAATNATKGIYCLPDFFGANKQNHCFGYGIALAEGKMTADVLAKKLTQQLEVQNTQTGEIFIVETTANGKLRMGSQEKLVLPQECESIACHKEGVNLKITYDGNQCEILNYTELHKDDGGRRSILLENDILEDINAVYAMKPLETNEPYYSNDGTPVYSEDNIEQILQELDDNIEQSLAESDRVFDTMYGSNKPLKPMLGKPKTNRQSAEVAAVTAIKKIVSDTSYSSDTDPENNYCHEEYFIGGEQDFGMPWDAHYQSTSVLFEEENLSAEINNYQLDYTTLLNQDLLTIEGDVLEILGSGVEFNIMSLEYELLSQIDVIDMTGYGSNVLNIDNFDKRYLATPHELTVYGDDTTVINLSGKKWRYEKQENFHVFTYKKTTLYIDTHVLTINKLY